MCRLYGLRATHPTRAGCELLAEQNALLRQSIRDERGEANLHGWGIGFVTADGVRCARQADPAHESPDFRERAAAVEALTVLAHVRRATVGAPRLENTHPFRDGNSMLIHNGTVPEFDRIRPHLLEAMSAEQRASVRGDTDSEHIFRLLLSRYDAGKPPEMAAVLAETVTEIRGWVRDELGDSERPALNLFWTIDEALAGTRLDRSLWHLRRDAPRACSLCGTPHAEPPPGAHYRSVVVASERITNEAWEEIPNGSVFHVDNDLRLVRNDLPTV